MAYKTIYITDNTNLSLQNNNLKITKAEIEAYIPIEDIYSLVIDGYKISLSMNVLNALSEAGINIIMCNDKKLPVASILPFEQHSRQKKCLDIQISMKEPFKKKLWQSIIIEKIKNQHECLCRLNIKNDKLLSLSNVVLSGDTNNREAVASKIYFEHYLNGGYRSKSSRTNSLLNYGYAIVRSQIARSLAGYGFYTSIGIHHKSELNQYNLADDMIEIIRPVVDYYVAKYESDNINGDTDINSQDKIFLSQVLNEEVIIENQKHRLFNAIDIYIQSLKTCFIENDYNKLKIIKLC